MESICTLISQIRMPSISVVSVVFTIRDSICLGREDGKNGIGCLAVSCNLQKTSSHPRYLKYSFYSTNKGDRRIYHIRLACLK